MMDNRIFNVNGRGLEMLHATLALAFWQEGWDERHATAIGWKVDPKHGLVLLWHADSSNAKLFPVPLTADRVADMVFAWLSSDEAKNIPCEGWDANVDHDGDNEPGWRVYVEDWGHIGNDHYAICAVKPAYNWLGK